MIFPWEKALFLLAITMVYGYRTFKIGALLDRNDLKQKEAFREAIDDINEMYDFTFESIIEEIEEDDPYNAMKTTCNLLSKGVVGILGPLTEDNSNIVQSILDAKEVPHIEVRWDDYPLNGTVINLHPFPDTLTRTYYDLVQAWEWKDYAILYEDNESLHRVGELVKLFEPYRHNIVLKQLGTRDYGDYRPILKDLRKSGVRHFLLDCSIGVLAEVLRQCQQVGLMTDKYSYIVTNLDAHTVDLIPYQHSETNITLMRFVNPYDERLQSVAGRIHGSDDDWGAGFKLKLQEALIYDAMMMFAEAINSYQNIIDPKPIDCDNLEGGFLYGTAIVNRMKNLFYSGLTGNISFGITGFRSEVALDIIELREGGEAKIGDWNSSRICYHPVCPLNINNEHKKEIEDLDLLNRTFRVMTTLTEPYGMRVESEHPLTGNAQYEGLAIDMIDEMSKILGFNYTFIIRDDKKNGEKLANGEWSGIIGDIKSGKVDLAITDLTITKEREDAVDFTSPFMMLGISILYQKPRKAPPSFFSFADPFAFEVWKLIIASWVGISLILFIIGRISYAEWENPYPCIEEPEFLVNQLDLRNCLWCITGAIMQQGSEIELKSVATRMIAGMWWFFTLVMVSSYTANLAAFLTTENPDPHFTNFRELIANAEDKGIKYGAKKGGATAKFFEGKAMNDTKGDYAKAWRHMMTHFNEVMVTENELGVSKAAKERYAFFMESCSIEYETQRKCDLNQVGSRLDEKGYGIAMRKNSSYRNALSNAVLQLQQSGKLAEIKKKWWEEKKGGGQCSEDGESSEATRLNLKVVGGVFWVVIGGVIIAFLGALIETFIAVSKKSIRTKTPFSSVLLEEFKFYFKFTENVKQVTYPEGSSQQSRSREKELEFNWTPRELTADVVSNANSGRSRRSRSRRRSQVKRGSSKKYDKREKREQTC